MSRDRFHKKVIAMAYSGYDESKLIIQRLQSNPLVKSVYRVLGQIDAFKAHARAFYFEVILSTYRCPKCRQALAMASQSECACASGHTFDPTIAFQNSICCQARLVKKTFHYACAHCHKPVSSRFLFDERVFDKTYFREMMQESRRRAKAKKEEIRRLLAESRSEEFQLLDNPDIESIPGLINDLDSFIQGGISKSTDLVFERQFEFNMNDYQNHILSVLTWGRITFSAITPFIQDCRRDRIWRFITLIYMQQDREVDITQDGSDLWVQRVYHEAHHKR